LLGRFSFVFIAFAAARKMTENRAADRSESLFSHFTTIEPIKRNVCTMLCASCWAKKGEQTRARPEGVKILCADCELQHRSVVQIQQCLILYFCALSLSSFSPENLLFTFIMEVLAGYDRKESSLVMFPFTVSATSPRRRKTFCASTENPLDVIKRPLFRLCAADGIPRNRYAQHYVPIVK
jgi:hypothetical protein